MVTTYTSSANTLIQVERLVGRLLCTSEPVNLFLAFRSATLDIITTYMFGYCLEALEHPTFSEPLVLSIQNALPLLWISKSFSWFIPVISVLPRWIGRKAYEQLKAAISIRRYLLSCLHRTREEVQTNTYPKGSTICHYLYDSLSQGSQIFPSERCIVDEALSLLQAGSDTVGNTCTVGSFHILNSPTIHAKLHGELCSNWLNKSESIDLVSLQNLPYLVSFFLLPQEPTHFDNFAIRQLSSRRHCVCPMVSSHRFPVSWVLRVRGLPDTLCHHMYAPSY